MIDMTGQIFWRLKVLEFHSNSKRGAKKWLCQCECGNTVIAERTNLVKGSQRSCGCLRAENNVVHNMSKTPVYTNWSNLKARCGRPSHKDYKHYGGRGIELCDRWQKFENFLEDMGMPPSRKHSVERISNEGNYEPGNCRWATHIEQSNNKRNSLRLELDGITRTQAEWGRVTGLGWAVIQNRLTRGKSIREALTTPKRVRDPSK